MSTETMTIEPIVERLLAGQRLSEADRGALAASRDLLTLGMAADTVRRQRHGDEVTFVRVAEVPVERAAAGEASWEGSPGELRLTGAPADLAQAVAALAAVKAVAGTVPVTGFSLADLQEQAGDQLAGWLTALAAAGLAEIADAPVDRGDVASALRAAQQAGVAVGRLSVGRPSTDVTGRLDAVAALVAEFRGVAAFAPLAQQSSGVTPTTGYEDVHLVALARLLVPVAHVQVDWHRYGPKLAQVALTFGADDLDGVSSKDEVAEGRRRSPLEEVTRNITAASSRPVERGPFSIASR